MPISERDKITISNTISGYISNIPVHYLDDFFSVVSALQLIKNGVVENTSNLEIMGAMNTILNYMDPDFCAVSPENQDEFISLCNQIIDNRIQYFENLSSESKLSYINEQISYRNEVAVRQVAMNSATPPVEGSDAHVISEEEMLLQYQEEFNNEYDLDVFFGTLSPEEIALSENITRIITPVLTEQLLLDLVAITGLSLPPNEEISNIIREIILRIESLQDLNNFDAEMYAARNEPSIAWELKIILALFQNHGDQLSDIPNIERISEHLSAAFSEQSLVSSETSGGNQFSFFTNPITIFIKNMCNSEGLYPSDNVINNYLSQHHLPNAYSLPIYYRFGDKQLRTLKFLIEEMNFTIQDAFVEITGIYSLECIIQFQSIGIRAEHIKIMESHIPEEADCFMLNFAIEELLSQNEMTADEVVERFKSLDNRHLLSFNID